MGVKYEPTEQDYKNAEIIVREGMKPVLCYRTKTITSGELREQISYPIILCSASERKRLRNRTPEQMQQLNEINRSRRITRLVHENFSLNDHLITLTNATAVSEMEMRRRLHNFIQSMRRIARKKNAELKYIYAIEWTNVNDIINYHVHMIMNRFCTREEVEEKWSYGFKETKGLQHIEGTFTGAAKYLIKSKNRLVKVGGKTYVCSQNLREPKVTISDTKMTRGRVSKIEKAVRNEEQVAIIERMNPGWMVKEIEIHYSEYLPGAYIYAVLIKRE